MQADSRPDAYSWEGSLPPPPHLWLPLHWRCVIPLLQDGSFYQLHHLPLLERLSQLNASSALRL